MPADYHMHLAGDGDPLTDAHYELAHLRRYVETARSAGVSEIGFSEHVYRFSAVREWHTAALWQDGATADIDRYVAAVRDAARAGLPVRLGLELDWLPGREAEIGALAGAYPWDYLLGSYHWLGGREVDHRSNSAWDGADPAAVWRAYVDGFCAAARSGLYDSMSHPDLAKVFGHQPGPNALALYAEMVEAAAEGGVCIEASTAGYRRTLGELYPAPRLLRMFRERGVPATLGSDAHSPDGVARDFPRALAELEAAGYETVTVFDRRRRRQVPIA
ncbi:MAG: PHP domain-containing protein [Gaiellales bacterium]